MYTIKNILSSIFYIKNKINYIQSIVERKLKPKFKDCQQKTGLSKQKSR